MAKLLYCKYVPKEVNLVRRYSNVRENHLKLGNEVQEFLDDFYRIIKPPMLEMIFQEGESDYIFDMIHEVKKYFGINEEDEITEAEVESFVKLIANGEIKVNVFRNKTYTLL